MARTCDFLIIGGGIIGLSVARKLKSIFTDAKIIVLEKEIKCGFHASGRNSGVLHAGFYYTPDSLKAKLTRVGNQRLTEYCEEKNIPLNKCGKLVIAKNAQELEGLAELLKRGLANGVVLYELTQAEVKKMEPRAITYEKALFSPSTSSVNPQQVLASIQQDAQDSGIETHVGVKYLKRSSGNRVETSAGQYEAGYIINAAGLYADKIAKDFNYSKKYRILPFKGIYLYSSEPLFSIRTHIYPVPDLKNPFLGVHFTVSSDGRVKIGPTAIPAFWREQYDFYKRFKLTECIDLLFRQMNLLMFSQFDFKRLAVEEIKKYSRAHLVQLASLLVTGIKKENYTKFGPPGIRAQLLNIEKKQLEMDFILEGDKSSMHVLNAVSPAFTSSFPFADYVCDQILAMLSTDHSFARQQI